MWYSFRYKNTSHTVFTMFFTDSWLQRGGHGTSLEGEVAAFVSEGDAPSLSVVHEAPWGAARVPAQRSEEGYN